MKKIITIANRCRKVSRNYEEREIYEKKTCAV